MPSTSRPDAKRSPTAPGPVELRTACVVLTGPPSRRNCQDIGQGLPRARDATRTSNDYPIDTIQPVQLLMERADGTPVQSRRTDGQRYHSCSASAKRSCPD